MPFHILKRHFLCPIINIRYLMLSNVNKSPYLHTMNLLLSYANHLYEKET